LNESKTDDGGDGDVCGVQSSKESITSMYSNAGDASFSKHTVTGDIEFGLAYNYKQSTLEVHIVRCRGIAAVDAKRNSSDPSVSHGRSSSVVSSLWTLSGGSRI